MTYIYRDERSI